MALEPNPFPVNIQPPPRRVIPLSRLFFRTDRPYTHEEIDDIIRRHGTNVVIGQNYLDPRGSLTYARSRGALTHWYMIGCGEPADGYNHDGRISYPTDQAEIANNCREMGMTRRQWDNGGWLQWHQRQLLRAQQNGTLPDFVEFDSLNNASNPQAVAQLLADFSRWRREHGITTRLVTKNLEAQHFPAINARLTSNYDPRNREQIDRDMFAPYHLVEEYASPEHLAASRAWSRQLGGNTFRTANTHDYRSPDSGFTFDPFVRFVSGALHTAGAVIDTGVRAFASLFGIQTTPQHRAPHVSTASQVRPDHIRPQQTATPYTHFFTAPRQPTEIHTVHAHEIPRANWGVNARTQPHPTPLEDARRPHPDPQLHRRPA